MLKNAFSFAAKNVRNAAGFLYSGGYAAARKGIGTALKNPYIRQMSAGATAGAMYGLTENLYGEDRISMARGAMYGAGAVAGWKGLGALKRTGLIGRSTSAMLRGAGRSLRNMI